MIAKIALGALGAVALAGVYVAQEGLVRLSVDEQKPGGRHIHLLVPAAVIPTGMGFLPQQQLQQAAAQVGPWMPAIRAACEELGRVPDAVLVEVRDAGQHVRIAKQGSLVLVDVKAPDETVHLSFPVKTLSRIATNLEAYRPPA